MRPKSLARRRSSVLLAGALLLAPWSALAAAPPPAAGPPAAGPPAAAPPPAPLPAAPEKLTLDGAKKAGNVLTFYGLRKLEEDTAVSDEDKLREWQAFIERSAEQVQYAKKAVGRWKNAARTRLLETARGGERDGRLSARDKAGAWKEFANLYARDPEAKNARKRAEHWTTEESKRLARAAEEVERARRPKVERIRAWMELLAWSDRGPEARAANKRIDELENQLFAEAENVDGIARVDDRTKLAAWKDVLLGRPTEKQRRIAEKKIAALSATEAPPPPTP